MERKMKYRRWLIAALILNLVVLSACLWNYMQKQRKIYHEAEVSSADVIHEEYLMPVGKPVGLYIHTKGVMVLGTGKVTDLAGNVSEPAKEIFQAGDYILSIDGNVIRNMNQAICMIQACEGKKLDFGVLREGSEMHISLNPVETAEHIYKIGIWLRDDTQGIGTVTYIDENQHFAALGHGITDIDTGMLMDISHGMVYRSEIISMVKGKSGTPGEIVGTIDYQKKNRMGEITANTVCGIFGTIDREVLAYDQSRALPVAQKSDIKKGPASMLCTVDGETKYFDVWIEKIDYNNKQHKNFVVRITDEEMLEKTNGILQGMSGSCLIQDGRIIGALTHVFVKDPGRGYGIFIENMK